ncbi:MAG: hypothetical protein GY838_00245 [bacterium]|nr:hypothetical protein [bacterium]
MMRTPPAAFLYVSLAMLILGLLHGTSALAQAEERCSTLTTPQLVKDEYFKGAHYQQTFPCLVNMIRSSNYKSNDETWNDHLFPVINHYFHNKLDVKDQEHSYELESILWLIMIEPRNEDASAAVRAYKWHENLQDMVNSSLRSFNKPTALTLSPDKATLGKLKQVKFEATYRNRASIGLAMVKPGYEVEVQPSDWATSKIEGDQIIVTGLKAGKKTGLLTLNDARRELQAEAELAFTGRMSVLWPIGGLAVTGGAAAMASSKDDGATPWWIAGGVSAAVTVVLFYKYFRGEGAPLLSQSDTQEPENRLAFSVIPGPTSIAVHVSF